MFIQFGLIILLISIKCNTAKGPGKARKTLTFEKKKKIYIIYFFLVVQDIWYRKENGNGISFSNVLGRFEYIMSPNIRYRLDMQNDCNLILNVCILCFYLKKSI